MLYTLSRTLLSVPAMVLRGDSAKDAELLVLRHENAALRRQISGPVRYEPAPRREVNGTRAWELDALTGWRRELLATEEA